MSQYRVIYTNKGNQTESGEASFTFPEEKMDALLQLGNTVTFSFTDLHPFQSREFIIRLTTNMPTETDEDGESDVPVNEGDVLAFNAPIATNTVSTKVTALGIPSSQMANGIVVYPNPVSNPLFIGLDKNISLQSAAIYNAIGQLISNIIHAGTTTIPIDF